jgi:hypothetical protein
MNVGLLSGVEAVAVCNNAGGLSWLSVGRVQRGVLGIKDGCTGGSVGPSANPGNRGPVKSCLGCAIILIFKGALCKAASQVTVGGA